METNEEQLWHEVRHFFLLVFAFCPVGRTRCERWLKNSSVLQLLQHSEFDLSLCSWLLFLQAIIDVAQHLPWLEGQRRWPQWTWIWSLKTQCATQSPIEHKITFEPLCIHCIHIFHPASRLAKAVLSEVTPHLPSPGPQHAGTCAVERPLSHPVRMQRLNGDSC